MSRKKADASDGADGDDCGKKSESLGSLTERFVTLLQSVPGGKVDMREVAIEFGKRQKRRLYDVTNVLEGIGLIQKCGKNFVQWQGPKVFKRDGGIVCAPSDTESNASELREETFNLRAEGQLLDNLIAMTHQSVQNLTDDDEFRRLAFVTAEDVRRSLKQPKESVILGLHSHRDTTVQFFQPIKVDLPSKGTVIRHRIGIKSDEGPADLFLLQDSKSKRPKKVPKLIRRVDVENVAPSFNGASSLTESYSNPVDLQKSQEVAGADCHDPQLAHLKALLYPTSYNLLMGTQEGSKNVLDIDFTLFAEPCFSVGEGSDKFVQPVTQTVSLLSED